MKNKSIATIITAALSQSVFPGCVVGIISNDHQEVLPFGHMTYEASSSKVHEETLYDVASITKAIPTSSLALSLIDHKQLSLKDPIERYLPELKVSKMHAITIFHLLTQTLMWDLRLSHLKHLSSEDLWEQICSAQLKAVPGSTYSYSNASSILLSKVIERISGKSLDELAQDYFFTPLQMNRTTFHPVLFPKEEIAPTEIDLWRGREVRGEVHDESAFILREKMIVGSAGLFSTVPDLLRFITMLLHNGTWKGKTYLSQQIIAEIETNQIAHTNESHGLGWELNQPWYMGTFSGPRTFGKTGFTGCHVMIDRQKGKALVLLSNSTYPKRPESKENINAVRRALADVVFAR